MCSTFKPHLPALPHEGGVKDSREDIMSFLKKSLTREKNDTNQQVHLQSVISLTVFYLPQ
jgi:hypothetical protein